MQIMRVGWLLRWAIRFFVRWLIRELLRELGEGVLLKVTIEGKVYWLEVKLLQAPFAAGNRSRVIDLD